MTQINQDLLYLENEARDKFGNQFNFNAGITWKGSTPVILIQAMSGQNVGHAWYDRKDSSILHNWLISKNRFLRNS